MKMGYIAVAIIGVLMIVVGFAADQIGVGPNPGMGWKQISLMVAGGLVVVVSLYLGKARN